MSYKIVVVGTSLGGLSALKVFLSSLPKGFPLAIVIVQHLGKQTDNDLGTLLQQSSALPIEEPEDKDPIIQGHVYIAPPDYHLLVEYGSFSLSIDEPVNFARPSIDVLFESAAESYREKAIGVILTGANSDGSHGVAAIKTRGGLVIVQDPVTAEAPAMPESASKATQIDRILPLSEISPFLVKMCIPEREANI